MVVKSKSSKHVARHSASHAPDTSVIHVTSVTSPEVSAPSPTPVTSVAALLGSPVTPPGDLPPTIAGLAAPAGWEPTPRKRRGAKGLRPKATQIAQATAVAKELTGSTTYAADFGSRAPAAAQVAFVVTNAAKWRDTWAAAKKFFAYAAEQRAVWENEALVHMDRLKPAFDYVTSRDPAVGEKYAATSKYLGATNAIAARAATSRKAKAKEKKGVTSPAPAVAPVAPETPAATASPAPAAKG